MSWSISVVTPQAEPIGAWGIVCLLLLVPGCGLRGFGAIFGDGENTLFHAVAGAGAGQTADAATPPAARIQPREPRVCVFDYDLTLSSHNCAATEGKEGYFCRVNTCDTYGWFPQCLAPGARAAVAQCVRRHAYIGIASKADADYCWADKVLPIVSEDQFPELTHPASDREAGMPLAYPDISDRANWNCENCAYTMDGTLGKPAGIRRILRHFGLDPNLPEDRARVIFWDDTATNIADVKAQLPEARAILVPSHTGSGVDGGCGITQAEIDAGWAP